MRAWVVEDNDQNFELVDYLLGEGGWEVVRAASGAALRALVESGGAKADVVLLDMNLPDASGLELLAELRDRPALADVAVVAVTAHAMSGDRERCLAAGCDAYLSKPIDPSTFLSQIAAAAAQGRAGARPKIEEAREGARPKIEGAGAEARPRSERSRA